MAKTLFQKIIDREIPARIEHEDERCIVIHDIQPQAPVHLLIIPKKLIPRVGDATAADESILGHLFVTAGLVAKNSISPMAFASSSTAAPMPANPSPTSMFICWPSARCNGRQGEAHDTAKHSKALLLSSILFARLHSA